MKLETFPLKTERLKSQKNLSPQNMVTMHGNIKCHKFQENVKTLVAFEFFV